MHIQGVADFVKSNLTVICEARKDAFYRLKKRDCGWRAFYWRLVGHMGKLLHWSQHRRHDVHFILDTTCLSKRGQKIEEVSWIYDHNHGKAVQGYEVLTLGVGGPQGFYPLDFGCHFSRRKGKHYRPAPFKFIQSCVAASGGWQFFFLSIVWLFSFGDFGWRAKSNRFVVSLPF
jgi:hypothetical protein